MSERPIEEVIGWRPHQTHIVAAWGRTGWLDTAGGFHDRAEVDDLAAWLNDHTIEWWPVKQVVDGVVTYCVLSDDDEFHTDHYSAILAALTAAVRKVADA